MKPTTLLIYMYAVPLWLSAILVTNPATILAILYPPYWWIMGVI